MKFKAPTLHFFSPGGWQAELLSHGPAMRVNCEKLCGDVMV